MHRFGPFYVHSKSDMERLGGLLKVLLPYAVRSSQNRHLHRRQGGLPIKAMVLLDLTPQTVADHSTQLLLPAQLDDFPLVMPYPLKGCAH
jgi:hypothetical protein